MRRRLALILFLVLLGCLVVAARAGLLSPPFSIFISLGISTPDWWQKSSTAERAEQHTGVRKETEATPENSRLAANEPSEEKPEAPGVNSTDSGSKPDRAATLSIARISSDGPSVFGGTAAPGTLVTVLDGSTPVATATANANGDWSLVTEYKFANTDPKISLRVADASEKGNATPQTLLDSTPPSTGPKVSDQTPPAVRLLKEFEGVVASAREEAKQRDTASSVKEGAAKKPQSAELLASPQAPPEAAKGSTPSGSRPSITTTPVPMTFVYNEATLTPEGRGAARLLLEYLMLKKFASVTLSGHADERGLPDYNMELSRQRLIIIEHLLRDGGYQGRLDLLPKGATEPFRGVDRSRYPPEQLMQLDRRVELRVAN